MPGMRNTENHRMDEIMQQSTAMQFSFRLWFHPDDPPEFSVWYDGIESMKERTYDRIRLGQGIVC